MANEIVFFDSTEFGAPTLNNAAGSLDSVLYACLVSGFNTNTLTSVVVSSEVATLTLSSHGYADQRMLQISGATGGFTGLNGRVLFTRTGANTGTFPCPGVADGTATGTIVAKRSPLGWTRPLSSGNVSMYARSDVTATTMGLRVDDSGSGAAAATYARLRMVESWTDLSTFTNPAPSATFYSGGGLYVPKGQNDATAKAWFLIGDSKRFYLMTDCETYPASSTSFGTPYGGAFFGDINSDRAGDAYHCMLSASTEGGTAPTSYLWATDSVLGGNTQYHWLCRAHHGIGLAIQASSIGIFSSGNRSGAYGSVYPNPANNGFRVVGPILVAESNGPLGNPIRGVFPGMAHVPANVPVRALHMQIHPSVLGSTRKWLTVGARVSNNVNGCVAFDITGPWG